MPYIYKITNKINGKVYIGKTMFSIEERWKQHCRERIRNRCEKRPLYNAMNKYGVENFIIEQIEECSEEILSDREIYWINYFDSFKNGYNATCGGDGKYFVDYRLVIKTYSQIKNIRKTAQMLNVHPSTVRNILKAKNIEITSSAEVNKSFNGKNVYMFSMDGKYIMSFISLSDAVRYVLKSSTKTKGEETHISAVCKGRRKSAYGYKWSYDGPEDRIN